MKTILVVGDLAGAATYHAGDEAMAEADVELLRLVFPEVKIIVTSSDPAWSARALGCDAVQSGTFKACQTEEERVTLFEESADKFLSIVADVDAVVIAGGGNLTSNWPEHLYERALFTASAVKLHKPVIILGQTLGPRLRPTHTAILRDMLRIASLVGVREAVSAGIASSLGVEDSRILRQADDALFLSPTVPPEFPAGFDPTSRWLAVTVHPFAKLGSQELTQFAAELVCGVADQKIGLLFVPHARAGEGVDGISDVDMAAELARLTGGWALPCPNAREAVWAAQYAYAVISTRYHPLVFASSGGVPFLSLPSDSYTATKCLGAQAHVGLVRWSLGLSRAIAGELSHAVGELIQRRDELSAWLTAALPRLHKLESQRRFAVTQCFADYGLISKNSDECPAGLEFFAGTPQPLGLWACAGRGSPCDELLEQFQPASEPAVLYIESLTEALKFSKQAQATAEAYAKSLENALQAALKTQSAA